jgi:hypothetical protein
VKKEILMVKPKKDAKKMAKNAGKPASKAKKPSTQAIKNKAKAIPEKKPVMKGINTAGQALHSAPTTPSAASCGILNPRAFGSTISHSLSHVRASTATTSLHSKIKKTLPSKFAEETTSKTAKKHGKKTVNTMPKPVNAKHKSPGKAPASSGQPPVPAFPDGGDGQKYNRRRPLIVFPK